MLFYGCKDNSDPCAGHPSLTYRYYLSDSNKAKIPYSNAGFDTLIYISNTNDTAILYGQGKLQYWVSYSQPNSGPDCGNHDYWYYENIEYNFKSTNVDLNKINFHVYFHDPIPGGFTTPQPPGRSDLMILTCNGSTEIGGTNFTDANSISYYTKNILINGQLYNGIETENNCVYNYKYGILQFQLNGKTWTKKL